MSPIAALLVVLGLAVPLAAEDRAAALLGSKELDALRTPDRVESLPVESLLRSTDKTAVPTKTSLPGRFRIVPEPRPVPADLVSQISRLLLSRSSFADYYTACIFDPGIAFRFWKGERALDVLVCFHCGDLAFQVAGAPTALGAKLAFEPIRAELARLVRAARPGDPRFEKLEDKAS